MLLRVGGLPNKCSKMTVGRQRTAGTGYDQKRVVVKVRKRGNAFTSGVPKMLCKGIQVRLAL